MTELEVWEKSFFSVSETGNASDKGSNGVSHSTQVGLWRGAQFLEA